MSQRSSDLPMLVNFSIYFLEISSELGCIVENINSPLTTMLIKGQKLLTNRNCLNFLMFRHGAEVYLRNTLHTGDEVGKQISTMASKPRAEVTRNP